MVVEEALVDVVANRNQRLPVGLGEAAADAEVAGVVDGGLGPERAALFEVLLDLGGAVVHLDRRLDALVEDLGVKPAGGLARDAAAEHDSDLVRTPERVLVGQGALTVCREKGIAFCEPDSFYTEERWRALQAELERRCRGLAADDDEQRRHGTVGAVARDCDGNLAAATSTGGMTGKMPGRVGDSPILGAGTYAHNSACAVSATGHGEMFMRYGVAFEIAARIRQAGLSLDKAARAVIDELDKFGGRGGVIAVGRTGAPTLPFNTVGMYRGYVLADGKIHTAIWNEPHREW